MIYSWYVNAYILMERSYVYHREGGLEGYLGYFFLFLGKLENISMGPMFFLSPLISHCS